jgi:uncharacterized protein YjbI with pentapeptide repeats
VRTRTVRDTEVLLPSDDPGDLAPVDWIPRRGERVTDRVLTGDRWARATLEDIVISHCWLSAANLSSTTFTSITLDRCVLSGCTLIGTGWDTVTLRNVVFEDCRLDYATLTGLTTAGPTAFVHCSFTETTIADSTLAHSAFDRCSFDQLELVRCNLRGADLRGNDLDGLTAVTGLHGVRLDQEQLATLTEVLVRELAITVTVGRQPPRTGG